MGLADDMKNITEGITDSYASRIRATRDRIKEVGELAGNTQKTVRDFASERKHMGAGQAKALGEFVGTLRGNVEDLRKAAGSMIHGFQKDHKAMAAELKEKAEALRGSLAQGEADRMKDYKELQAGIQEVLGQVRKSVKDIKSHVADKLEEFSGNRAIMSQELKKDLVKHVADIARETKAVLGEARTLVDGFSSERKMMSANWQGMAASMAKKRGVQPAVQTAPVAAEIVRPEEARSKKRKAHKKRAKK